MPIDITVKLPSKVEEQTSFLPSFAECAFCVLPHDIGHSSHLSAHLENVHEARGAPAPSSLVGSVEKYKSEQTKWPIYNGRPFHCHYCGSPAVVYNESLAQLKHDWSDLSNVMEPPANYVDVAAKLFHDATPIYDGSERERGEVRCT